MDSTYSSSTLALEQQNEGVLSSSDDKMLFDSTPQQGTLSRYFELLNQEDFQGAALLFSESGVLYPPFESKVVGPAAIASYLEKEAKGLQLFPQRKIVENKEYKVFGAVQTPFFTVNVRWTFTLNNSDKIESVEVKLLADLKELLTLNRNRSSVNP